MKARILVIEDDASLRRGLCDNLTAQGWEVRSAGEGGQGLELALSWKADLILLDLMLPGVNGYEICRSIRLERIDTPVLMLTARGQTEDVVRGLELGADDYVVKPFALRELLARVRALLRRRDSGAKRFLFTGGHQLDLESRRLTRDGHEVPLTPKEFDLLATLLAHAGRALSRERLIAEVWGHGLFVTPRSVDRCVKTLRPKLSAAASALLTAVRGVGYRWDGELESDEGGPRSDA